MGSFTDLRIGRYSFESFKSEVYAPLMTIFRESDKQIRYENYETGESLTTVDEDADCFEIVEYRRSVLQIKQRLEIMGFSLRSTREDFESCKSAELADRRLSLPDAFDPIDELREIELLEQAGFEDYIESFREIKGKN